MYGLAAISQANGWAMAGAGAGIVLSGLAVLSILISLFPRLIHLFDEKEKKQPDDILKPKKQQSYFLFNITLFFLIVINIFLLVYIFISPWHFFCLFLWVCLYFVSIRTRQECFIHEKSK